MAFVTDEHCTFAVADAFESVILLVEFAGAVEVGCRVGTARQEFGPIERLDGGIIDRFHLIADRGLVVYWRIHCGIPPDYRASDPERVE